MLHCQIYSFPASWPASKEEFLPFSMFSPCARHIHTLTRMHHVVIPFRITVSATTLRTAMGETKSTIPSRFYTEIQATECSAGIRLELLGWIALFLQAHWPSCASCNLTSALRVCTPWSPGVQSSGQGTATALQKEMLYVTF